MSDARKEILDIAQHRLERLPLLGRRSRKSRADLTRSHPRKHGKSLDAPMVVGDPIDDRVAVPAELLRRHVVALLLRHHALLFPVAVAEAYCGEEAMPGSCARW